MKTENIIQLDKKNIRKWLAITLSIMFFIIIVLASLLKHTKNENEKHLRHIDVIETEKGILYEKNGKLIALVKKLEHNIDSLQAVIEAQGTTISQLQEKLKKVTKEKRSLKKEIEALRVSLIAESEKVGRSNERIKALQASINKMRDDKEKLSHQAKDINKALEHERSAHISTKKDLEEFKFFETIANNTTIKPLSVNILDKENREIKKKITSGNWRQTQLRLQLTNEFGLLKPGMNFAVEIYDIDNDDTFAVSEGYEGNFDFDIAKRWIVNPLQEGNILEVSFPNTQRKSGYNYQVRVYFLPDPTNYESKIPLLNGILPIVVDREIYQYKNI